MSKRFNFTGKLEFDHILFYAIGNIFMSRNQWKIRKKIMKTFNRYEGRDILSYFFHFWVNQYEWSIRFLIKVLYRYHFFILGIEGIFYTKGVIPSHCLFFRDILFLCKMCFIHQRNRQKEQQFNKINQKRIGV